MKSSYSSDDVELLLKDITGMVKPLPALIREKKIQSGIHYCEMLPLEYEPSKQYMAAYHDALEHYGAVTARAAGRLAEKLYAKRKNTLVLVSLARAGIPVGILIKRYLKNKYCINVKHYAISIIRGRGIDKHAMEYILSKHDPGDLQFVDGWIGKGAIQRQLKEALADYPEVDAELGVLSDPANLTTLYGTREDFLIPSSCLNATVTGLISRTFLRDDIIGAADFHGAVYYAELEGEDLSKQFLTYIEQHFDYGQMQISEESRCEVTGTEVVERIAEYYQIGDINFVKPGIGETTRVLLRRIPWKVIIKQDYERADELRHIYALAAEKKVRCEVSRVPLGNYKVCGIIKQLSDV